MPTMTDPQIAKLQDVLNAKVLGSSDQKFAADLLHAYHKYGKLTPKQQPWVQVLLDRASKPKPEPKVVSVGEFSGVVALFQKAKEHLKFPKIVLQCDGKKITLALAGKTSKYPGSINVMGEGSYPDRPWYGRVDQQGNWTPSMKVESKPEFFEALQTLLVKFAKAPARVAKEHGKLTGNCCFCNSPLSDPRSTAAGFGPVCADHYGLTVEWKTAVAKSEAVEKLVQVQKETAVNTEESLKSISKELVQESLKEMFEKMDNDLMAGKPGAMFIPPDAPHGAAVELEMKTEPCVFCGKLTPLVLDDHFVCGGCQGEMEYWED